MHVLYEEEGDLKAGAVLAQGPASFQVESPHGRRSKVRAGNVLLTFDQPAPAEGSGDDAGHPRSWGVTESNRAWRLTNPRYSLSSSLTAASMGASESQGTRSAS